MTEHRTRRKVEILVVDANDEFLNAISGWLGSQPDLQLVGIARDGLQGVAEAARLRPDLVLLDAFMPGVDGFDAARRIKQSDPRRWVVITSLHEDSMTLEHEAWIAGADAYVPKAELIARLPALLRELGKGGTRGRRSRSAEPGRPEPKDDQVAGRPIARSSRWFGFLLDIRSRVRKVGNDGPTARRTTAAAGACPAMCRT